VKWKTFFTICGGVGLIFAVLFFVYINVFESVTIQKYNISVIDIICASLLFGFIFFVITAYLIYNVKKFKFFIEA